MDNTGVRVPMTRMRRKLSVEQNEEAMSPSTPSTPTKKRPTRLAKPLLDNIDENLTINSPRRVTRKSVSKDNMELNEEKPLTPARRNMRIKSNTSITSETTQILDSPRAKRAARRNSIAGSDTEGPATPVRPTRRARKDSSSSIENQAEPVSKSTKPLIEETILEEPVHNKGETDVSPNSDKSSNISQTSIRKSPRLLAKKGILTTPDETFKTISQNINEKDDSSNGSDKANKSDIAPDNSSRIAHDTGDTVKLSTNSKRKSDGLDSNSSKVILEDCKNNKTSHEMTVSQKLEDTSIISNGSGDKCEFSAKNKRKSDSLDISASKIISEDGKNNESSHKILSQKVQEDHEDDIANEDSNCSTTYAKNIPRKLSMSLKSNLNTDDQCVPVVDQNVMLHSTVISEDNIKENSCEPMDVDETITENVSYRNLSKNPESKNNSILSVNKSQNNIVASPIKVDNLSNRKLSVSFSAEPQKDTSLLHSKNNTLEAQNNNSKRKSSSFEVLKPNTNENQHELIDKIKTDTPIKHKDLQNLGIQTSTPNIEKPDKTTKTNSVNNSKHNREDSSSADELSDGIQSNECSLVDNEAEDAGDYESGDSQDEEQKQYEKENEIVERGETLTSEEDLSNDSDYEKDSFIVSSNEDDDVLLSGTGDDLGSSDNELTMSAKSKRKYNERKNKERVRASKEMLESRHRSIRTKSESFDDVISRGKKGKRQRIESVIDDDSKNSSTSEDEQVHRLKIGKNRQRLDSTLDDVRNNSKNATIRQSEYSFTNKENEITTIFNESITNVKDPLIVKGEPATPNKEISSLNITEVNQIEVVQVDENVSVMKSTTTLDPLQESSDDSASLSSENEEIKNNYESVLASLNNSPSEQKLKKFDTSLNLKKGTIKKLKQNPIIDQLNITQTKKKLSNDKNNKIVIDYKKGKNKINENLDSPDYTNLSVEVNVDSSDSHDDYEKLVVNDNVDFIPLVQSKGNISFDKDENMDVHYNETSNKNKSNRKSFEKDTSTQDNEVLDAYTIEADLDKFLSRTKSNSTTSNQFLDINNGITDENINDTLNDSTKRNKKIRKNSEQRVEVPWDKEIADETADTTLNESTIKKKKNRTDSGQHIVVDIEDNEVTGDATNTTLNESSMKKKKNRKNSGQNIETVPQDNDVSEDTTNTTLNDSTTKKKKNRKNSEQHLEIVPQDNEDIGNTSNTTFNKSSMKKKKSRKNSGQHTESLLQDNDVAEDTTYTTLNESATKRKKNRKTSEQHMEIVPQDNEVTGDTTNMTLNESSIKKKKTKKNSGQHTEILPQDNDVAEDTANTTLNESTTKNMKDRKISEQYINIVDQNIGVTDDSTNTTLNESTIKKKKNRKDSGQHIVIVPQDNEVTGDTTNTTLNESSMKKKKNGKNSGQHTEILPQDIEVAENTTLNELATKKKKNRRNSEQYIEIVPQDNVVAGDTANTTLNDSTTKKKKNRKNSGQHIEILPHNNAVTDNGLHAALDISSTRKKKKAKMSEHVEITSQEKYFGDKHSPNKNNRNDTSNQKIVVLDESINLETTDLSTKKKKKHEKLEVEDDCLKSATTLSDATKPNTKRNKRRRQTSTDLTKSEDVDSEAVHKKRKVSDGSKIETKIQPKSVKRKRDDVEGLLQKKVFKDEFNIRRLPSTIIDQLEEKAVKPNKSNKSTKSPEVISTVTFNVEETKQKKIKNKPSRYLEESVYIDTDDQTINEKPNKHKIKKPKVLPFLPTVSTSNYGCTTNFKINIIPKETTFIATATDIPNFKDNYLYNQKIKRLGTYEKYKRNIKMSKF